MDHIRPQDSQESKGSVLRYREHVDEPLDKRSADRASSPSQDEKRPIRRVRSPSRPRAWLSNSYKPKLVGRFFKPRFQRDDYSFYKPSFGSHRHHYFSPRVYMHRREHFHPKLHHITLKRRERERDEKKERYEQRESSEGGSPPKQSSTTASAHTLQHCGGVCLSTKPFLARSSSSRDKDVPFTVCQSDRNQSRERDHRGTKSKDGERSRDRELPSTASQTAARDRAIQQKRREIDEVYYQECEMFGLVVKMLIAKDPSLERPIQSSLQENLRDIGKRCVEAMEKFIDDYDSREQPH